MQSSSPNRPSQARNQYRDGSRQPGHALSALQTSLPAGVRPRSDDSWVEVSSQPSCSSLSSAADEIITTGLRVQHDSNARRRRRPRNSGAMRFYAGPRAPSAGTSSQEEYDESESESDRAVSSNEGLQPSPVFPYIHQLPRPLSSAASSVFSDAENDEDDEDDEDDDDDENSTAVGYAQASEPVFTPQPTAFSHPPSSQRNRQAATSPYFSSRPGPQQDAPRHSYPSSQPQHTPYNMIAPSHQPDHDAALRASLSTLLSCAAAARSLPKSGQASASTAPAGPPGRIDPATLCMVPESVALGEDPIPDPIPPKSTSRSATPSTSRSCDKHKRKAAATSTSAPAAAHSPSSKDRSSRAVKKARRTPSSATVTPMEDISPTLLTWVVSAGVVVLVSALSFSAGYVVGREAGKAEMEMLMGVNGDAAAEAGRCGREVAGNVGRAGGLGLRRFRFGSGGVGVRV